MTPRDWILMAVLGMLAILFAAGLVMAWLENRNLGDQLEDALSLVEAERALRARVEGLLAWLPGGVIRG